MVKQTAGRDSLGDFAPKFAELNDDVLFGEVWSREDKLSLKNMTESYLNLYDEVLKTKIKVLMQR